MAASSSVANASASRWGRLLQNPSSGALALVMVLVIAMSVAFPGFATGVNAGNVANQMVFVLLLALGMTVVLITGGIDLSVGSVMGLSAAVGAYVILSGVPLILGLLAAVAAGAFLGWINGLMITRLGLPDFIATLAMLGVARGLLFLWTNGVPMNGYMLPEYYIIAGLQQPFGFITVPILLALGAVLAIAGMLKWTSFGRHAYGVGSNPQAAQLSSVPVARIKVQAYVVSGLMAGLTGMLMAGRTSTVAPTMGIGFEIAAIAAAIIGGAALTGGRGTAFGAVVGALVLSITANAINISGVSSTWQQVVTGMVLLVAVVFDRVSTILRERSTRLKTRLAHT
jgi:ribose/xylose/arabinose/galactoside ABC-type transport system permease subunit